MCPKRGSYRAHVASDAWEVCLFPTVVVNVGSIEKMPIPPLLFVEKQRIAVKVDEPMVLCDRLATQLTTAIIRHQLPEATPQDAVSA